LKKNNQKQQIVWTALVLVSLALPAASAQTVGSSPSDPAPVGAMLAGIVECGQGYTSHELYDMRITLLEVLRGDEAWKRLKQANASNKPPAPGFDYVLARIKFEYQARGTPGLCIHQLSPEQFTAYSANGEDYKIVSVVPPKPELRKGMKSGEAVEGWVVLMVSQQDKAPLMSYSADAGGAVMHGGGMWFLLK
jgi:hypothetical protein